MKPDISTLLKPDILTLRRQLGNSAYRNQLVYGMTPGMLALLWAAIALAVLTLPLAFRAVRLWRQGSYPLFLRMYFALVALAAVIFVALLWNLNLLGFYY
jgi:hypothetical protein